MLFATELTNECALYLITRLTPRAHPHGADLPQIILTQRASLLLLYFSFLTLSFFSFFSFLFFPTSLLATLSNLHLASYISSKSTIKYQLPKYNQISAN